MDNDTSGQVAQSEKDGEIPMRMFPNSRLWEYREVLQWEFLNVDL